MTPTNSAPQINGKNEEQRPLNEKAFALADATEQSGGGLLEKIISEASMASRDHLIVKRAEFDYKQRLARMFAKAGCFKDIDKDESDQWLPEEVSIARAMVKIELGESMGFTAAESMSGIDIIKGRPAIGAALRAARMQRAGFSWPQMNLTQKGCWMPLCFKGTPMMQQKVSEDGVPVLNADGSPVMTQVVVSFTETDARLLGLLDKTASMYKKDPSSMYFARTITRAQRRYGPDVLGVGIMDTVEAEDLPDGTDSPETRRAHAATDARISENSKRIVDILHSKRKPATSEAEPTAPAEENTNTASQGGSESSGIIDPAGQQPQDNFTKPESAPADLPHYEDWADGMDAEWLWIGDKVFRYDNSAGNYRQHSERPFTKQAPADGSKPSDGGQRRNFNFRRNS